MMKRMRYVGQVSPVSVRGKGVVKRGDIVSFVEQETVGLSRENWKAVEMESFDRKMTDVPHVQKRMISKPRRDRKTRTNTETGADAFPSGFNEEKEEDKK